MRKIVLILLLIFCQRASAEKPEFNWTIFHWPPLHIVTGEEKGEGRYDKLLALWQAQLPQFTHTAINMNWGRAWKEIEKGSKICSPLSLQNAERNKLAYFSRPNVFGLPNRIITRESIAKKLGMASNLSLEALVQMPDLAGGIDMKRSLSKELDMFFSEDNRDTNLTRYHSGAESLIGMLERGRVDYIIEYGSVISYAQEEIENPFVSIGIKELPLFIVGRMACPKTPWGKERVKAYDEMLTKNLPTATYRALLERWHDADSVKLIRELYDDVLINQTTREN